MLEFNEHYIFHAKELIKLITSTSQEAYIVGECLRDLVLDREIDVVEIFTSLGRESIINLFNHEQMLVQNEDYKYLYDKYYLDTDCLYIFCVLLYRFTFLSVIDLGYLTKYYCRHL